MPRMRLTVWPASMVCSVLKDQVAGFRRAQRDFDRVAVAHFADENDLGRLAQRGAQAVGKAVEINAQFALVERGLVVRMHEIPPGLPA
jgi:hypothetical protein